MTWDVPTENDCPECGQTMFKRSGRGAMKPFCINPDCKNFLPEEKRGYRKSLRLRKTQSRRRTRQIFRRACGSRSGSSQDGKKAGGDEDRCKKARCEENGKRKNGSDQKDRSKKAKNTAAEDAGEVPKKSASRRKKEDAT